MLIEDYELGPTLHWTLLQWQQEADGADAPQEVLAFNLDKIALVVPDRRVVQALKEGGQGREGRQYLSHGEGVGGGHAIRRAPPAGRLLPGVMEAPVTGTGDYSIEDTMIGFNKEETTMLAKMLCQGIFTQPRP